MLGSCDCECDPEKMTTREQVEEQSKKLVRRHAEILKNKGPQTASSGGPLQNNAQFGGKRRKHKATHKKRKTK